MSRGWAEPSPCVLRRGGWVVMLGLLAAPVLGGCGASETVEPSAPTGWTADGPSFGVDRASWSTTLKAADPLLDRLPPTLAGQPREVYRSSGEDGSEPNAGAVCGEDHSVTISEEYVSEDTEDGSPELMDARSLLTSSFMLALACAEDSYHGNALPLEEDGYPEVGAGDPIWFSCAVDAAEGEEDFAAHAAGWTSRKTAWLVIAPDETAVRSLVTSVYDAVP